MRGAPAAPGAISLRRPRCRGRGLAGTKDSLFSGRSAAGGCFAAPSSLDNPAGCLFCLRTPDTTFFRGGGVGDTLMAAGSGCCFRCAR